MSESRFRFRRSGADEPIVINGVTYRSREEIPENLRPLWDDFERQLQRAAHSFGEPTAHREPQSPPNPNPNPNPPPRPRKRWLPVAVVAYLIGFIALAVYGLFYRNPDLIFPVYDGWLVTSLPLLFVPFAWLILKHHSKQARGWKTTQETFVLLALGFLFAYLGAFLGVAKLLHHLENQPGEMFATVSLKEAASRKHCTQLALQEFRFMGDRVCVNSRFFNAAKVGERIRVTGHMSRYGLYVYKLETLDEP